MNKFFNNGGCGRCVVLKQKQERVLIASETEFIVANYLQPDGSWSWGHYYKDLDSALEDFNKK